MTEHTNNAIPYQEKLDTEFPTLLEWVKDEAKEHCARFEPKLVNTISYKYFGFHHPTFKVCIIEDSNQLGYYKINDLDAPQETVEQMLDIIEQAQHDFTKAGHWHGSYQPK